MVPQLRKQFFTVMRITIPYRSGRRASRILSCLSIAPANELAFNNGVADAARVPLLSSRVERVRPLIRGREG
jgi:hypothetical protein